MTQGCIRLISINGPFKWEIFKTWNYNDYNDRPKTLLSVYESLDKFLVTLGYKSLIEELNEMQKQINGDKNFESKTTIPLYFVNLILRQHNLKLEECYER